MYFINLSVCKLDELTGVIMSSGVSVVVCYGHKNW